jgi:hypothetical protein
MQPCMQITALIALGDMLYKGLPGTCCGETEQVVPNAVRRNYDTG